MLRSLALASAGLILAGAAPAMALTCKDDIAAVERRLNSAGAEKVEGKAPSAETTSPASPKALDKPPAGQAAEPGARPSASGVAEAKTLLELAKTQDKAGDEKNCQETMTKVKEKAGALP